MCQRRTFQIADFARFRERLGELDEIGCRVVLRPADPRDARRGSIHTAGRYALVHLDPTYAYDPESSSFVVSALDPDEPAGRARVFWNAIEAAASSATG